MLTKNCRAENHPEKKVWLANTQYVHEEIYNNGRRIHNLARKQICCCVSEHNIWPQRGIQNTKNNSWECTRVVSSYVPITKR